MRSIFLTNAEVERKALAHRRALGFMDDQAIDMMTLLTKLKVRYKSSGFGYLRVPNGSLLDAEAHWNSDKKTIAITETTFCSGNSNEPRGLFTVMHEVAHALLGHKGKLNRAQSNNEVARISDRVRSMEREANRYAAAFLIPDIPSVRKMTATEISDRYRVSAATALFWKRDHP